ncbi:MAG: hypothetical protein IKY83_06625, partial [Proteobacteria bacterium]|nr:hypothetical protein [Pseudomonadota bacterium]
MASSKYESIRPFVIEVVVCNDNVEVVFEINDGDNICQVDYEVLCSDSETGDYEHFDGNFRHIFKDPGVYKIFFRGKLPGLVIKDLGSERNRDDRPIEEQYHYYL